MSKETGGPAFPTSPNKNDPTWAAARDGGMTLRDYFAAKAMMGFISGSMGNEKIVQAIDKIATSKGLTSEDYMAKESYKQADAMLKERNK